MFQQIETLVRKPGSTLEALFWEALAFCKIAKRKREDRIVAALEQKQIMGQKLFTVPNALSASRTFPLAPFFYFSVRYWLPAAVPIGILVVAALTDWLDGVLARRWGTSKSGGLIDACSDKMFMGGCLISLRPFMAPSLFWTVLGIESLLLSLALIAIHEMHTGRLPRSTNTDSVGFGKWKFATQCAAVFAILLDYGILGNRLFAISAILAVLSIVWKGRQIFGQKIRAKFRG